MDEQEQPDLVRKHRRSSGYPSPATGYDIDLDLNTLLIRHPAATFFLMVNRGTAMEQHGIHSGDILIVDRAETPRQHSIVVAVVEGQFVVRHLVLRERRPWLLTSNPSIPAYEITKENLVTLWGVVTYCLHPLSGKAFPHITRFHEQDEHRP